MLKFTMEAAAARENVYILLSKQHFSSLPAYQRVTSSERRVSKYSPVVIRVQGLISSTSHLLFAFQWVLLSRELMQVLVPNSW